MTQMMTQSGVESIIIGLVAALGALGSFTKIP